MFRIRYKVATVVYRHWFVPEHLNIDAMNMMDFVELLFRESTKRKLDEYQTWNNAWDAHKDPEYLYYKLDVRRNKRQRLQSDTVKFCRKYKTALIET